MAKGFRTGQGEQRTAHISFAEGHVLHGLEMEVGLRVSVGVAVEADKNPLVAGIAAFVREIKSWNLEDEDGKELPISEEVFRREFDVVEAVELVKKWVEVVTLPDAPLGQMLSDANSSKPG